MANETPPVVQASPNSPDNALVADPSRDTELNDSLSKFFNQNEIPNETQKTEVPKEEIKADPNLERQPETKPEAKKEVKPVEAEKPLLKPDEIDKIDPKEKGAWGALKNANKRAHTMIEERDSEIQKLKAVVAERGQMSQKELDALKAENSELAKYRAMIDIQADPDFLSKFDQPIEKTVESLKGMLRDMNVSEEVINQVDFTNTKLMDEIIGNVGEHRDKFIARKLQRKVEELVDLTDKRNETLAEQKDKYKETLEAKKKQSFEKDAEAEGRAFKHLESVAQAKDKAGNSMFPFLNKMEIKETATQPEIDQINAHNKMVELMNQKVQQAYKMNLPEERMEVAVAAAAAHYMSAQLKAAQGKIQSLEAEIKKIAAVSNETEKPKAPSVHRNGNKILDTDEALAAHFGRS